MATHSDQHLPNAERLCTACGLCCTGHLFNHAFLEENEVDLALQLGFTLQEKNENHRFPQPCQFWADRCMIYLDRPNVCQRYQCKILKAVATNQLELSQALALVAITKKMIAEIELLMPILPEPSFRRRLVSNIKHLEAKQCNNAEDAILRLKAGALMVFFTKEFGVKDLFDGSGIMKPEGE